jgi:hypothetical protein
MYSKPKLERFGTFRELTQWGLQSATDGGSIFGIGSPGCSTFGFEIDCPAASTS